MYIDNIQGPLILPMTNENSATRLYPKPPPLSAISGKNLLI